MAIGAVLFGLALVVLAGVLVADPFLRRGSLARRGREPSASEHRHSALLAIRDLDFDFRTGKVLEQDYRTWRARLLDEAAGWQSKEERAENEPVQVLETHVAAIRTNESGGRACGDCGYPLLGGERYCPSCGVSTARGCPWCGAALQSGDRFCRECGRPLGGAGGART